MKKRTLVTHPPQVQVPADNRPLVAPIYQSVKFTFDDVGATLEQFKGKRAGFYYSRVSNPTLRQLAARGLEWLAKNANGDGGWGDTTRSFSNLSTTALCWSAFGLAGGDERYPEVVAAAERWIVQNAGNTA